MASRSDLVAVAEALLRAGRPAEVLQRLEGDYDPTRAAELENLRGRCHVQLGRHDLAAEAFRSAVALDPRFDRAWANLAKLSADAGQLDQALEVLESGLRESPDSHRLLSSLARGELRRGRPERAAIALERLVTTHDDPTTWRDLAAARMSAGQPEAALQSYLRAAEKAPHDTDLLSELCTAGFSAGRTEALRGPLLRALDGERRPEALQTITMQALELALWDVAERTARAWLDVDRTDAQAMIALARALAARGDAAAAIAALERHAPEAAGPLASLELARRQRLADDPDRAAATLQTARARFAGDSRVWVAYAEDARRRGLQAECLRALRRAVELDPASDVAHAALSHQLVNYRRTVESTQHAQTAVRLAPAVHTHHASLLFGSHFHLDDPVAMRRAHEHYGAKFGYARPVPRSDEDLRPERTLRVGYVSRDLREHSCAYFMLPILEHPSSEVLSYCYGDVERPDELTERFRRAAHVYRDIHALSNQAAAELIASDRIDLLLDLGGMTAATRLGIYARRPAPVQLTYLGYPDTTGLPSVDFRITDAFADPAPEADSAHTERLLRMPSTAWCFDAGFSPETTPSVDRPPRFCCFNALAKLTDEMLEAWARILDACPGWRLMLKTNLLSDPEAQSAIVEGLRKVGLDVRRVDFQGWTPTREAHLRMHAEVDIALDPSPYAGTTTSCDALWMGLPLVSLRGRVHSARVGVSLLSAVGLGDLVADDLDEYVALAVELARDEGRRRALRTQLRARMLASPLGNPALFVPQLESLYRGAWRDYVGRRSAGRAEASPLAVVELDHGRRAVVSADPTSMESFPLIEGRSAALGDLAMLGTLGSTASVLVDRSDDAAVDSVCHAGGGNRVVVLRERAEALRRVELNARANGVVDRVKRILLEPGEGLGTMRAPSGTGITWRVTWGSADPPTAELEELLHAGSAVLWSGPQLPAAWLTATHVHELCYRPGLEGWSPRLEADTLERRGIALLVGPSCAAGLEEAGFATLANADPLAPDPTDVDALLHTASAPAKALAERLHAALRVGSSHGVTPALRLARARALATLGWFGGAARLLEEQLNELRQLRSPPPRLVWNPLPRGARQVELTDLDSLERLCVEGYVKLSAPSSALHTRAVVGLLLRYQSLGGQDLEMARRLGLMLAREDAVE